MPFNKDTAAAAGSKGGGNRWKNKAQNTYRNKTMLIKLSQDEMNNLITKATAHGVSKNELVIRAVQSY